MAQFVKLVPENLKALREVNPRLMSYNVEFAEVTGGTFWKAYTPEQVAGTEEFHVAPGADGIAAMYKDLMQVYAPIDLYNEKLRSLAKELGTAWVRVSGTWATKTYYDFDNTTGGIAPEGYLNVLTKEQWIGVLDFVKAIDAKLMISVANCPGLHSAEEPWNPSEAEKIFRLSKEYGVPIDGAEFANESATISQSAKNVDSRHVWIPASRLVIHRLITAAIRICFSRGYAPTIRNVSVSDRAVLARVLPSMTVMTTARVVVSSSL